MKKFKIILLVIVAIGLCAILSGCGNKAWFDTTYTFNRAIVSLPDGDIVKGTVSSWLDFEDGDQIQVTINGTTYLVHSSNIVLISD